MQQDYNIYIFQLLLLHKCMILSVDTCASGMYGPNCVNTCGQCLNSACNPISGSCANGCNAGYEGATCKQGKTNIRRCEEIRYDNDTIEYQMVRYKLMRDMIR